MSNECAAGVVSPVGGFHVRVGGNSECVSVERTVLEGFGFDAEVSVAAVCDCVVVGATVGSG